MGSSTGADLFSFGLGGSIVNADDAGVEVAYVNVAGYGYYGAELMVFAREGTRGYTEDFYDYGVAEVGDGGW